MSSNTSMPPDREAFSLMTKLKLDRFKLRKIKFEDEYNQIMTQKTDSTLSLLDKIQLLSKSIERLFAEEGRERYLKDFDELFAISKANTSTSNNILEDWYQRLMKVILGGKKRSEYNYLFGLIMSQWLSEQKDELTAMKVEITNESILTNEHLEKIIFDRPQLDLNQWSDFLQNTLFSFPDKDKKLQHAFDQFKSSTEKFGKSLLTSKVSSNAVRTAIKSLLSGAALDEYRKRLLTKMQSDESAVNEFASSLSLMISDLSEWKWPSKGVRGIFRRNLVGRYRCHYEEDFLTAIFLEHIGLEWSYHFKQELEVFFDAFIKKSQNKCLKESIQYERFQMQKDEYWMASLPDQGEFDKYSDADDLDLKTKLFHLVNVEIQLHQVLQPNKPFTVVTADLEWFGPSVSHEIIQIFLQFCGVSQIWLDFFNCFLKQPVYYKPNEPIRYRQRGVPISHSLSFLFSELLIFGLDLYVYRSTDIFNYRLHDDFWFFHSDTSKVEQVWTLMNQYTQMTGLKFNDEKCGSIQIHPSNDLTASVILPRKDVHWGLLTLQSSGRFIINRNALIPFLDEMKIRLKNATTILEWVNLYNQYIRHFMRNFGKCANILGTYHTEQMIETFQFLHQYVFSETNGNALIILTNQIIEQFPSCLTDEICEAWCYWPLTQGGLGLEHIFLTLYSYHHWLLSKKLTTFNQLPAKDIEVYADILEKYEQSRKPERDASLKHFLHNDGILFTFDAYIQSRETRLSYWKDVYIKMLAITQRESPDVISNADLQTEAFLRGITVLSSAKQREYNRDERTNLEWLVCYYGGQIESTFNQLDFIDSDNLPIGLITLMTTTKINWDKQSHETK